MTEIHSLTVLKIRKPSETYRTKIKVSAVLAPSRGSRMEPTPSVLLFHSPTMVPPHFPFSSSHFIIMVPSTLILCPLVSLLGSL